MDDLIWRVGIGQYEAEWAPANNHNQTMYNFFAIIRPYGSNYRVVGRATIAKGRLEWHKKRAFNLVPPHLYHEPWSIGPSARASRAWRGTELEDPEVEMSVLQILTIPQRFNGLKTDEEMSYDSDSSVSESGSDAEMTPEPASESEAASDSESESETELEPKPMPKMELEKADARRTLWSYRKLPPTE